MARSDQSQARVDKDYQSLQLYAVHISLTSELEDAVKSKVG